MPQPFPAHTRWPIPVPVTECACDAARYPHGHRRTDQLQPGSWLYFDFGNAKEIWDLVYAAELDDGSAWILEAERDDHTVRLETSYTRGFLVVAELPSS